VIAASSPADCFNATVEAFTIATKYMTPVMLLTDGYIANGSEPWMVPNFNDLPKIDIKHPTNCDEQKCNPMAAGGTGTPSGFLPYLRDANLVRPWALPGTPGLEHRVGGLEKQDVTGNVNYEPGNHEHMVRTRAAKIAGIKPAGPDVLWTGAKRGEVLIVGWGSTFGAIKAATLELQDQGVSVSACHLRYLNPLPHKLGEMMKSFSYVLVPEMNLGQLRMILRSRYLVDAKGLNKVRGQPFTIGEIVRGVKAVLAGEVPTLDIPVAETGLPAGG
jgi:2-oxoglutarate/2-oxoacid ferredoxin oxidoreductase subunit alpha